MIKLCGFAVSNYYNKIKLVLLEKNIPFAEEKIAPSQDETLLKRSPLGKIPFIETSAGSLSESQAILEYLEDSYPEKRLYPRDLYARAKCREIIQHLELNVELIARRLYGEAFFGQPASQETKDEVREKLAKGFNGVARLLAFAPYAAGADFSAADCVAWPHFSIMSMATTKVYGEDLTKSVPGLDAYINTMMARPHVQKVAAGRDKAIQEFFGSS